MDAARTYVYSIIAAFARYDRRKIRIVRRWYRTHKPSHRSSVVEHWRRIRERRRIDQRPNIQGFSHIRQMLGWQYGAFNVGLGRHFPSPLDRYELDA